MPVLAAFSARHPNVRARLRTGTAKDAVRALEDASCDLALTFFAPARTPSRWSGGVRLPQFIIAPPDHPVTRAGGAACTALSAYRWVLPGPEFGGPHLHRAGGGGGRSRIVPTFEAASLALQRALILEAGALAVLPRAAFADEIAAGRMVAVPFPAAMPVETSSTCASRPTASRASPPHGCGASWKPPWTGCGR